MNGGFTGILASGPTTVSGNTVANSTYGMQLGVGITATSNKISNAFHDGISSAGGKTYKSNTITKVGVGIEFNCQSPTVLGNTINDATIGIDNVPGSFSGANSFDNVVTLRTDGCASNAIRRPDLHAPHSGPVLAPAH